MTTATTAAAPANVDEAIRNAKVSGPKPKAKKTGKAKKTAAKPAPAKAADTSGKTPLKTICAKLGVEPKLARRKLRKAGLTFHSHRDRWMFTPTQADKAREIIKGEA